MQADDGAAEGKPEPGAAYRPLAFSACEFGEQRFRSAGRQARAFILHRHEQLRLAHARAYMDARARRGVLRGVLEEVAERLLDERRVDPHQRQVPGDVDVHRMRAEPLAEAIERRRRRSR